MRLTYFIQILTLFSCFTTTAQELCKGWKYAGPGENPEQVKGLFKAVWMDADNNNFVLAGSSSGGLFKTENALSEKPQWTNITDTYKGINFGVSDIAVKPATNNKTIYIATGHNSGLPKGYGNGVIRTFNGGLTWEEVGPKAAVENLFQLEGLVTNPENFKEMIAYTTKVIYVTTDEWKTFTLIEPPLNKNDNDVSICDVEFAPFEPGKFYFSTRTNNKNEAKVFVGHQFGKELSDITPSDVKASRIEVAVMNDSKYTSKFYIAFGGNGVDVKYFNGKNFGRNLNTETVSHAFSNAYWCLEFTVNKTDTNIMYLAMTESSRSKDGGKTFEKIGTYNAHNTHADNRGIFLAKSTPSGIGDVLLLANDGGISYANSFNPVVWKSLNGTGLDANQFWGVDVLQSDSLLVTGGAQDNGGFLINNFKNVNNVLSCGDGYLGTAVDQNSAIVECNGQGMLYDNIKNGKIIGLYVNEACESKRPMIKIDSFLYMGYRNIWRIKPADIEKGKTTFTQVGGIPLAKREDNGFKSNTIKTMDIGSDGVALVSYAHPNWADKFNTGKLFYTTDFFSANPKWTDLTSLMNDQSFEICRWSEIISLQANPFDQNSFFMICKDEFDQTNCRVYNVVLQLDSNRCKLQRIENGLPRIGFNALKIDGNGNAIYLSTDNGVYYSTLTDSIKWMKLNGEKKPLPNVAVMQLAFNYHTNTIYAATYGRGIWQTQIPSHLASRFYIGKNFVQNAVFKVDGELLVKRKKTYTVSQKLILTTGTKVVLEKGSVLIIKDKKFIRNEDNVVVSIEQFIKKHKTAKIIIEK